MADRSVVLPEGVNQKSKSYVVSEGKRRHREIALALDESTGTEVDRTIGTAFEAQLSYKMLAAIEDPERRIVIHHNHPRSTSFSFPDVSVLQRHAGLRQIFAHAHNGSTFSARRSGSAEITRQEFDRVRQAVARNLTEMIGEGVITQKAAALLESHMIWSVMDRKGLLKYKKHGGRRKRRSLHTRKAAVQMTSAIPDRPDRFSP